MSCVLPDTRRHILLGGPHSWSARCSCCLHIRPGQSHRSCPWQSAVVNIYVVEFKSRILNRIPIKVYMYVYNAYFHTWMIVKKILKRESLSQLMMTSVRRPVMRAWSFTAMLLSDYLFWQFLPQSQIYRCNENHGDDFHKFHYYSPKEKATRNATALVMKEHLKGQWEFFNYFGLISISIFLNPRFRLWHAKILSLISLNLFNSIPHFFNGYP